MPPPGETSKTVTRAVPGVEMSGAEISAFSCVLLITVVGRLSPFHPKIELLVNPVPLAVSLNPEPPAGIEFGDRVMDGSGLEPAWCTVKTLSPMSIVVVRGSEKGVGSTLYSTEKPPENTPTPLIVTQEAFEVTFGLH